MPCTYRMRKDSIYDEDGNKYTVYGIEAVDPNGNVLVSFPDIFFDKQKAEHFVNLCNKNVLELIHLADVVEDALA